MTRYRMREKMIAIGDDFWIEDADGNRAYRVNGKIARVRDTWVLEDPSGAEVALIRVRKLGIRDAIKIHIGDEVALVRRALSVGFRDRYRVELTGVPNMTVQGRLLDHEYAIEQGGSKVAQVSKKWFGMRNTYGVDVIDDDVDPALILSGHGGHRCPHRYRLRIGSPAVEHRGERIRGRPVVRR